jgi:hypothetical protein
VTAELAVHHPGKTKNPHNLIYSPGTSSMGSAVAVSAGMALAAFGTQTGASITRPASYTGVFGFKPSYGVIPRTGVLKTTDTLDHVVGDLKSTFEAAAKGQLEVVLTALDGVRAEIVGALRHRRTETARDPSAATSSTSSMPSSSSSPPSSSSVEIQTPKPPPGRLF